MSGNNANAAHSTPTTPNHESNVNLNYIYDEREIIIILESRIKELRGEDPNVFSKPLGVGLAAYKHIEGNLHNVLDIEPQFLSGARMSLIPVKAQENHWIGLVLDFATDNNLQKIIYLDSISLDDTVDSKIEAEIRAVYPDCNIEIRGCMQQEAMDYTSSSAYLIENFVLVARNLEVPTEQPTALQIRTMHMDLLLFP